MSLVLPSSRSPTLDDVMVKRIHVSGWQSPATVLNIIAINIATVTADSHCYGGRMGPIKDTSTVSLVQSIVHFYGLVTDLPLRDNSTTP